MDERPKDPAEFRLIRWTSPAITITALFIFILVLTMALFALSAAVHRSRGIRDREAPASMIPSQARSAFVEVDVSGYLERV